MNHQILIEREFVVNSLRYLREDLEEQDMLCDASLSLLSDACDYLGCDEREKAEILGRAANLGTLLESLLERNGKHER